MKNFIKNLATLIMVLSFVFIGTNPALAEEIATTRGGSVTSTPATQVSINSGSNSGSNNGGGSLSVQRNRTLSQAPTIITNQANPIGSITATLNGAFDDSPAQIWFEYNTTQNGLTIGTNNSFAYLPTPTTPAGLMTAPITGLTPSTTYYFRAVGFNDYNGGSTSYGVISSFTTTATTTAPVIVTNSATSISANSATLNGAFDNSPTAIWFEYNTNQNDLTIGTNNSFAYLPTPTTPAGLMTAPITGLTPSTTYYFRATGLNNNGTSYGSILSFTTTAINNGGGNGGGGGGGSYIPVILTISSSSVSTTGATLNGTVDPNNMSIDTWFEYGTSPSLSTFSQTPHVNKGSGTIAVAMTQSISGLLPHTNYYFRAVGQNSNTIKKGDIKSFTTLTPVVIPTPPTPPIVHNNTTPVAEVAPAEPAITESVVIPAEVTPTETDTSLTANSIFGLNFLPSTTLGWISLIVMILCLAVIGRKIFMNYSARNAVSAGNVTDLPTE